MSTEISIGEFLRTRAHMNPRKEALYDVALDKRVTYRELNERANRCANALLSLGLKKGDRAALLANNGHQFAECFFGAAKTQ
ncbi:MAG: class I adenylate-forming enzyme family protein [Halioglobus sp.]